MTTTPHTTNTKRKTKDGPGPVDVHVGAKLRERRGLLGWSQKDLGERIGLTFQQIQKYERGANRIGSGRLYDFARIMNVDITYFFDGLDDGRTIDAQQGIPDSLMKVAPYWKTLRPDQIAAISNVITTTAGLVARASK